MLDQTSISAVNNSFWHENLRLPLYESYCFSGLPNSIKRLFGLPNQTVSVLPYDKRSNLLEVEASKLAKSTGVLDSTASIFANLATKRSSIVERLHQADCLPNTVWGDQKAAKGETYKKVIFLFIDGFGWRFFEQFHKELPALMRFINSGCAAKLTAQFPSTTAAHVTTMMTGMPVYETGIYEWFYYEPKAKQLISPLLFAPIESNKRDSLTDIGLNVSDIFPRQSIFSELNHYGIKSTLLQSRDYFDSAVTRYLARDTERIGFKKISEGLDLLALKVLNEESGYFYAYFDGLDSTMHHYGPSSRTFMARCHSFFDALEDRFFNKVACELKDTLIILTADHGQIEVSPRTTIYLDRQLPELNDFIATDPISNAKLVPAGSARDLFLHIQEEYVESTVVKLKILLQDKARVFTISELINAKIFSDRPSNKLLERLGNVVILANDQNTVWWSENNKFEMKFLGHHGGLTAQEMDIPLLSLSFD